MGRPFPARAWISRIFSSVFPTPRTSALELPAPIFAAGRRGLHQRRLAGAFRFHVAIRRALRIVHPANGALRPSIESGLRPGYSAGCAGDSGRSGTLQRRASQRAHPARTTITGRRASDWLGGRRSNRCRPTTAWWCAPDTVSSTTSPSIRNCFPSWRTSRPGLIPNCASPARAISSRCKTAFPRPLRPKIQCKIPMP